MSPARHFIEKFWGDLLAVHLIYLGIIIIYFAHGDKDLAHVGESLMFSGAVTLRFKSTGQKIEPDAPINYKA